MPIANSTISNNSIGNRFLDVVHLISISDAGIGTDTVSLLSSIPIADSGTGTDTATFTMSLRFNNDLGNNYNWNRHRVGRWGGTDVHDFATQGPSWPTEIQLGSTILSGQDVNIMIYPLTNKARSIIGQNLEASLGACSTTTIGGLWVNDVDNIHTINIVLNTTITAGEYWLFRQRT